MTLLLKSGKFKNLLSDLLVAIAMDDVILVYMIIVITDNDIAIILCVHM